MAPFFKHYNNTMDNFKYLFKLVNLFQLYHSFSMRDPSKPGYKEYCEKYGHIIFDPKVVHHAKINALCLFMDEQQYAREHIAKTTTPFIILTA